MSSKPPTRREVVRATLRFLRQATQWLVVLCVAHVAPKSPVYRDGTRLTCTIACFLSAIMLCLVMLEPWERFQLLLYRWRFENSPDSIERYWRRYIFSLRRLIRTIATVALGFFLSTGLLVLDLWYPGFNVLGGVTRWAQCLAGIALLLLPFAGGYLFTEVRQRRRRLAEQIQLTNWYQPRSFMDIWRVGRILSSPPPVKINRDGSLNLGGINWHWSELTKNCVVFGQTGSGKTVCVLNAILDGIMAAHNGADELPSALVIDPKGDFRGKMARICRAYGREDDLLVLRPKEPAASIRWNPLDSSDDELELASRFTSVMMALGMKNNESSFWLDSAKKFLRHSIALVRATNPRGVPPCFEDIYALATSFDDLVARTDRLDPHHIDHEQCLRYFANEWTVIADETRTSIQSYVTNMIDPFLMEPYRTLFSGRSTLRIGDMIDRGKLFYVDLPIAEREAMARTVGTFVKMEYQREVLKRPDKSRPSFFLCDEFQTFFTEGEGKGDADTFERTRQSNHVNIIATQNLPALLKHAQRKSSIDNLLGNCAIKIFLRNSDVETNEYATKLFGKTVASMGASGSSADRIGFGRLTIGGTGVSDSESDALVDRVPADRFVQLAIPCTDRGVNYSESILHHAARAIMTMGQETLRWQVHPI